MSLLRPALPLLLAAACAAPTAQKMKFEDAVPPSPPPVDEPEMIRPPPGRSAAPYRGLDVELLAFAHRGRRYREEVERGSPMPERVVENWRSLISRLDAFLARPPRETPSHEAVRAQLVLESELELDSRNYGEVPPDLAEDVLDRLARLGERVAEIRARTAPPRLARPGFDWPLRSVSITSAFGRRRHPISRVYRQHLGVDLAAERGQPVTAAGNGFVSRAEWSDGHGFYVELDHGEDVFTRYSHLSRILVEPGLKVRRGEVLGLVGSTGRATGAHLHFEFWRDGEARDPREELGKPPSGDEPVASR